MMSAPVPAPRSNPGGKKPIPAPRTTIPIRPADDDTHGKRGGGHGVHAEEPEEEDQRASSARDFDAVDVFNISFDSPIKASDDDAESVYSNMTAGSRPPVAASVLSYPESVDDDDDDMPPPAYPPPALPDDTYDVPSSVVSGGTTSSDERQQSQRHIDYESVYPSYPYNSDSDSCVDMTAGTIDKNVGIKRCESWTFNDKTAKEPEKVEPTYNNVDSTPTMSTTSERSFMRVNSMYENCDIIPRSRSPTKSVMMVFDPLAQVQIDLTQAEELSELEKALQGDLHGSFNIDNLSIFDDVSEPDDNYISPPPPPERTDSLYDSESLPPSSPKPQLRSKKEPAAGSKSSWYVGPTNPGDGTSRHTESISQKFLNKIKIASKVPDLLRSQFAKKDYIVARPMIQTKRGLQQKGMLFKITSGPVDDLFGELNARWCVLQPGALLCHADNSCDSVKENISIESILSVQIVQDQKIKYKHDEGEVYCFELNTAGKVRAGYVFGTKSLSERRVWMQNLADNMCHTFGSRITSDFKRIGWCYFKSGVNGEWKGAWLCLVRRKLHYIQDNTTVKYFDLRKARCFKLETWDETSPSTTDRGPNFAIHFTSETYYFRMWTQRETKVWCHIIKLAARDNGPNLHQQQLTKDDVPVIVAKCINFLYVYGSMTEGIYRKPGSNTTVSELMNQFRTDAWSVQLTDKYSANDVANVLKRFFRDLAEPLIDGSKRQYLYQVSLVNNVDERVRMYKSIFHEVHKVNYNTTRKLLGHLHFISTQSAKNLMSILNLASIWGPTLLHGSTEEGNKDRVIVAQLIELYSHIFPEDQSEKEKELVMLNVLKKYSKSPQGPVNIKPSGDFRVWIFLYHKEGKSFNMLVGPNKTAYEILCELSDKVSVPVHELVLEEQVLSGHLTRPIHHGEKVLDAVMRWSNWQDSDRKDNCLILNKFSKYWEYLNGVTEPLSADLKYADSKSKKFNVYKFEFQQAKLTYFKDRQMNMLGQWNIEDIFIYFGSEPKRTTQNTITFFARNEYPNRNKTRMYFGNVLVFPDPATKARWISSMWRAEHQSNLTPPPQHVNLMSS